ncbi:MAG: hypothetical protein V3V62_07985 [bacterium]
MGYVTAAYLVVVAAVALYWWSLRLRIDQAERELRADGAARMGGAEESGAGPGGPEGRS